MKKILCFIMSIILTVLFVAPSVFAQNANASDVSDEFIGAVSFSCVYDVDKRQVIIDGTVSHDFMISHGDYKIKVYSIFPGESYDFIFNDTEGLQLAESVMTVKFTFYIDADETLDRYSRYAIVFSSPDGENHITGQPMLPSISSDFEYDPHDRSGFKGIHTSNSVNIGNSGAGTVIVDVDLSLMRGSSSDSILYPVKDSYMQIKKSYVSELDKQIEVAALKGSRVYLRLLLNASDEKLCVAPSYDGTRIGVPDLHNEAVLDYVFAVSGFLTQRYSKSRADMRGMIVGTRIDDVEETNNIGTYSLSEYADMYTLYLVVVGNAVRELKADIDIVIPFSDKNDFSSDTYADDAIRPSLLLEEILYRLDKNVSGDFSCSVMIESDSVPLTIDGGTDEKQKSGAVKLDETVLQPDNISVFLSYLDKLEERFDSVPTNLIYLWSVDSELLGNALCCAYVYSYLRLMEYSEISAFVVSLDGNSYDSLRTVIRYIDTDMANEKIQMLAEYFGEDSWEKIMGSSVELPVTKYIFETEFFRNKPADVIGEFQYMDFKSSYVYGMMREGNACKYVRSDYDRVGMRVLNIASDTLGVGETVETVGCFEYPESYEYTQYLSLTVEVFDKSVDDGLYEITLTLGNEDSEAVATGVLGNGEKGEIFVDMKNFYSSRTADYIKVSVRCLTKESQGLSIWLHELKGYSDEYDTQTLNKLITERRQQLRNEDEIAEEGFDYSIIVTVVGIVFAVSALAIGLMIVFRRDNDKENGDTK